VRVLFVCVGNQGRSVMAERLFRAAAPDDQARSAGSRPGDAVHPGVLEALAELGIDASDHVPQRLTDELIDWADTVIATCDDACPVVPGKHYENWQIPDPVGLPVEQVRPIRDAIAGRVRALSEAA
jgi:arsenate reductase (thioredoxin)